jgi:hypothetical protein
MNTKQIVLGVFVGMWCFFITATLVSWFIVSQIHANSGLFAH